MSSWTACMPLHGSAMLALCTTLSLTSFLAAARQRVSPARPTPAQLAWHELEMGMFIHIAPQTWQDSESDTLKTSLLEINPTELDTDQWVAVADSMGAQYIVFVAKHEGGFCWWPTLTTDHCVRNIPWRNGQGDVLKDLSESCRRRGMKLGVYLSPQDRIHKVGVGGKAEDPAQQEAYEALFRRQLTEVLSQYGPMMEVWFDGSLIFDVGDILKQHAPQAVVFQGPQASIRWVGNEDGVAPDPNWNTVDRDKAGARWGTLTAADGDPDGDAWLPNECDARIRATWFWHSDNAHTLKTVEQLMDMYEKSIGRGAVLLLNQTPDRSGRIPEADARRAAEFGGEIRRQFGHPLAETGASGRSVLLTIPSEGAVVDRAMLVEDIAEGATVRAYVIEARRNGEWSEIARGTSIGAKKIDRFPPTAATEWRWTCTQFEGRPAPALKAFRVYETLPPKE